MPVISNGGNPVNYPPGGAFNSNTDSVVIVRGATSPELATLNLAPAIVPVTTTSKTLALSDANTIQDCNNASAQAISLPSNASAAFPINTIIQFENNGAGLITLTGSTGVTINGTGGGSFSTVSQYSSFYLRQESTDVWYAQSGVGNATPGGSNGNLQIKNGAGFAGVPAINGDATLNTTTGTLTVTKTNGASLANTLLRTPGITIDGSSAVPTTGVKGYYRVPYSGTITGWTLAADQSGSCVIDIWKHAGAIPTIADTITASALPTLSSQQFVNSTTLTGWNTTVNAGDVLGYNLNSAATLTRINFELNIATN